MIKKVLLSLGLFGLFGISFVYGYLGTYIELDTNIGGYIGNNYYIPDEYLNFQYSGYIGFADTCGFSSNPFLYYRTENGLTFYNDGNNPGHQFIFTGVCITEYNSTNYDNLQYCNTYTGDVYNDFYNKNLTFTKVIYNGIGNYHDCAVPNQSYYSTLCFIDINNIAYCFGGNRQYTTYGYYTGTIYSNISDIIEYYGTDSPFNGGGSSDTLIFGTGQYVELTGNLVYSDEKCTYGELINYLQDAGYNKYLCYGGLDNFDTFDSTLNYSPIPGTGKTLGQILTNASSTWDTPFEWFTFWNGLYQDKDNYISMWQSYPAVYRTWFDLYYQYGGSDLFFETVNEYCTMISLVSDYTDFYNGTYFRSACQNYIIPNHYKTGNNVLSLNWGGIFGSGDSVELQNGKTFISEFFTQIKNNISIPDKSDFGLGILPSYIIWALLGIILFRFLRK